MSLFGAAASCKDCPKQQQKIFALLSLWEENGYYSADYIDKLREAVKHAYELGVLPEGSSGPGVQDSNAKPNKSAPFVMPATHGDPATPWFDLPAGNLMPHIIPNSTRPINPDRIKPLQLVAGPADQGLVLAVKGLLDDVQGIFGANTDQDEKIIWDVDELGQPIILDEITGDVLEGEDYYGWSRTFCERMKRKRKGVDLPDQDVGRDRRSRSRSSSPGLKRRRYSSSGDEMGPIGYRSSLAQRSSRSNSRSASRSRSFSRSPRRALESPRREYLPQEAKPSPNPQGYQFGLPQQTPVSFDQQAAFQNGFNSYVPAPPPPPDYPITYNAPHNTPYPIPQIVPYNMPYNGATQPQYDSWAPPPPPLHSFPNSQWHPPPLHPPGSPPFQQQAIGHAQLGSWNPQVQANTAGQGGWQPPMQSNNGRGNNSGWNNNGSQSRGGRGNYRGRAW